MKDFTIVYENGRCEVVQGATKEEVQMTMDQSGNEYLDVIDGAHKLTKKAFMKLKSDPIGFMSLTMPQPELANPQISNATVTEGINMFNEGVTSNAPVLKPTLPVVEDMFFSEDGIDFKLSNGKLFKKGWKKLDDKEYRLLNKKSKKEYVGGNYEVQIKEWIEVTQLKAE